MPLSDGRPRGRLSGRLDRRASAGTRPAPGLTPRGEAGSVARCPGEPDRVGSPDRDRGLQPLRGDLRTPADHRGRPRHRRPRQPRRPALARAHLPQGRGHRRPAPRPRPTSSARPPRPPDRRVDRDRLGRGARPRGRRHRRHDQHARQGRDRRLSRQPQRALARVRHPRGAAGEGTAHPEPVQRELGRPDPPSVRRLAALRSPADDPDHRPRPDVVLPRLRRQPDGVQRVAHDRARLPEPAARAQGPRRPDGGGRPPPHRDRPGRRRARVRQAGHRRGRAAGDAARAVRAGRRDPAGGVRRRRRPGPRGGPRLHPRARGGGERRDGRDDPPADARAGRGRRGGGLRPDRAVDAGVRLGVPVGGHLPQRADRQPRPRGRGAVHRAGDRLRRPPG